MNDIRKQMQQAFAQGTAQAVREGGNKIQMMLDRLLRTHAGQDVADVRAALAREAARIGLQMPAADVDQYAQELSAGNRVVATFSGCVR